MYNSLVYRLLKHFLNSGDYELAVSILNTRPSHCLVSSLGTLRDLEIRLWNLQYLNLC